MQGRRARLTAYSTFAVHSNPCFHPAVAECR
jgi:hypothetical protein